MNLNLIAKRLDEASQNAESVTQISETQQLSLDDAYAVQSISLARRYQREEKYMGVKMGFTSKAKMEQMGVHDLIWGRLTDRMEYKEGEELDLASYIHPRVEPEIAFRISKELDTILDENNVMSYVDGVAIALEIIDSRYKDFKFSLEDVIADNCSSAGYAIGEWHSPDTDISKVQITLLFNEELKHEGMSDAILGNPWQSLFEASRLCMEYGETLGEGDVVLAGAATPAVHLIPSCIVSARTKELGSISIKIK